MGGGSTTSEAFTGVFCGNFVGGRKGVALPFIRMFGGTINTQFQSFFLSKFIHLYDFGGCKWQRPLAYENFVFCKLNMHNFRPFLV